jgi:hypothetical protein
MKLWQCVLAHQLSFDVIHSHDWLTYPPVFLPNNQRKPLVVHVHATEFDRSRGNVNPIVYDIEKRNGCCKSYYYR